MKKKKEKRESEERVKRVSFSNEVSSLAQIFRKTIHRESETNPSLLKASRIDLDKP